MLATAGPRYGHQTRGWIASNITNSSGGSFHHHRSQHYCLLQVLKTRKKGKYSYLKLNKFDKDIYILQDIYTKLLSHHIVIKDTNMAPPNFAALPVVLSLALSPYWKEHMWLLNTT